MFAFILPTEVAETQRALVKKGWIFAMSHVDRGTCKYHNKTITLPAWLLNRDEGYQVYYLCHEMAHAIAGFEAKHGPKFMAALRGICPIEYLHHEASYKPRNALRAGIVEIPEDF